jgi:hypothetical protein
MFCALSENSKADWVELIAGNLAELKTVPSPFSVSSSSPAARSAHRRAVNETVSLSLQVEMELQQMMSEIMTTDERNEEFVNVQEEGDDFTLAVFDPSESGSLEDNAPKRLLKVAVLLFFLFSLQ